GSAAVDGLPFFIQQPGPQGLQQPRPAVIGSAATDAQNDAPRPCFQRGKHQFASTVSGGDAGIALVWGYPMQTAGSRHLDHRLPLVRQPAPMGRHWDTERAAYLQFPPLTAGGGQHSLHRSFPTIGHGAQPYIRLGKYLAPTRSDGQGDPFGRYTFFERVGSDNQFHHSSTRLSSHTVSMPTTPWIRVA